MAYSMTQTAAAFRSAIKAQGFKARVRADRMCGMDYVTVVTPSYEARFTPDQIEFFTALARDMGLTLIRGMPIDPAAHRQMIDRNQWNFFA